jgi:hypothetical protein
VTRSQETRAPLRLLPKVGTRKREWLIVNEHGGLVQEFTGTQAQAERKAKELQL